MIMRLPKRPDMSLLVRQGLAKARAQGKRIGGRPKSSPNRQTEKKHRLIAQRVDAFIATGIDLEAARSSVVEDWIDINVEDWRHPDLGYVRRWQPGIATVRRAHRKYGRLFGR